MPPLRRPEERAVSTTASSRRGCPISKASSAAPPKSPLCAPSQPHHPCTAPSALHTRSPTPCSGAATHPQHSPNARSKMQWAGSGEGGGGEHMQSVGEVLLPQHDGVILGSSGGLVLCRVVVPQGQRCVSAASCQQRLPRPHCHGPYLRRPPPLPPPDTGDLTTHTCPTGAAARGCTGSGGVPCPDGHRRWTGTPRCAQSTASPPPLHRCSPPAQRPPQDWTRLDDPGTSPGHTAVLSTSPLPYNIRKASATEGGAIQVRGGGDAHMLRCQEGWARRGRQWGSTPACRR